jgi:hypothetical protein
MMMVSMGRETADIMNMIERENSGRAMLSIEKITIGYSISVIYRLCLGLKYNVASVIIRLELYVEKKLIRTMGSFVQKYFNQSTTGANRPNRGLIHVGRMF